MKEFPAVFNGQIRMMPGEVFKIMITEAAEPLCINTPWTLPYTYMELAKKELESLKSEGIITKQTKRTDRVHLVWLHKKKL